MMDPKSAIDLVTATMMGLAPEELQGTNSSFQEVSWIICRWRWPILPFWLATLSDHRHKAQSMHREILTNLLDLSASTAVIIKL